MPARERGSAFARVALAGALLGFVAAPLSAQWARAPRPFDHRVHEKVSCLSCHGTGSNHRVNLIRSARDCAGCHHGEQQAVGCSSCHKVEQIGTREVSATLSFAGGSRTRERRLAFRHEIHLRPEARRTLQCRDCHSAAPTLQVNRSCASCHSDHHRPEAECTSCHVKAPEGTHPVRVHLGCAAAGCHTPDKAPGPTASRTTCLACHVEKREHEVGGSCATCHRIPAGGAP